MTTADGTAADRAPDLAAVRQVLEALQRDVNQALAALDARLAGSGSAGAPQERTFSRPAPVAPRRMEQMTRTPEPTADLDDLVDVLVPRLVDHLVPALRDALREER